MHMPFGNRNQPSSNLKPPSLRGQIDPPERSKRTKTGWRYIQCTDNLDELKVLIPPQTAGIYARLLKAEAIELAKNDRNSAEELKHIEYLKDVMVRKCEKIAIWKARTSPSPQPKQVKSATAPVDFRLRRMEQWWEQRRVAEDGNANNDQLNQASSSTVLRKGRTRTREGSERTSSGPARGVNESITNGRPEIMVSPISRLTASIQAASSKVAALSSPHNKSNGQSSHAQPVLPQSPHSPHFDPNYSLAQHTTGKQVTGNLNSSPSNQPVYMSPSDIRASPSSGQFKATSSPNGKSQQILYDKSGAALRSDNPSQIDPSRLKSQFHAAYLSPSSSMPTQSNVSKGSPSSRRSSIPLSETTQSTSPQLQAQPSSDIHNPTRTQTRRSFTVAYSNNVPTPPGVHSPPMADIGARRRATVDGDDTQRSIPHPKGYMYSTSNADHSVRMQTTDRRYGFRPESGLAPGPSQPGREGSTTVRPMTRIQGQEVGLVSPLSSGSPSGMQRRSPVMRPSPNTSSRNLNEAGQQRTSLSVPSPNALPVSRNGSPSNASPNSAQSVLERQSRQNSPNQQARFVAAQTVVGSSSPSGRQNIANGQANHPVRRQGSSASLQRRESQDTGPVIPHMSGVVPQQQSPILQFNRDNGGSYTFYHGTRGMKDSAPFHSNRSSRYTSGDDSVTDPVIPDISLVMENELSKQKEKPMRRRLVPFRSSSDEKPFQSDSDSDSDTTDSDIGFNNPEDRPPVEGFYTRPYRPRDGYSSANASDAESIPARPDSRASSCAPSRGILKRSSSVCSQRSNKSVRIEIPQDRRALEEVREAEDKLGKAHDKLEEARKRKFMGVNGADLDMFKAVEGVKQAEREVRGRFDAYHKILAVMKRSQAEQETSPRYV